MPSRQNVFEKASQAVTVIDEIFFFFSTLIKVYQNKVITIVYKLRLRDCAQNWTNTCAASGSASKKKKTIAPQALSQVK